MVVARAKVLRDGQEKDIPSEELVPGDIVLLASGARVPADLRLVQENELKVEEAASHGRVYPRRKPLDRSLKIT